MQEHAEIMVRNEKGLVFFGHMSPSLLSADTCEVRPVRHFVFGARKLFSKPNVHVIVKLRTRING